MGGNKVERNGGRECKASALSRANQGPSAVMPAGDSDEVPAGAFAEDAIAAMLRTLGPNPTAADIEGFVDSLDTGGDGEIDLQLLQGMLQAPTTQRAPVATAEQPHAAAKVVTPVPSPPRSTRNNSIGCSYEHQTQPRPVLGGLRAVSVQHAVQVMGVEQLLEHAERIWEELLRDFVESQAKTEMRAAIDFEIAKHEALNCAP